MFKDHLHDMKIIHMAPSTYSEVSDAMVKDKGIARSADARADKVNGQYLTKARKLDTACFSSEPDVEARPILRRLKSYPKVRGHPGNAWAPSRNAVRTSICCYRRRPGPRPCVAGAKPGAYLWRRLSRPTQLGTAATGELN